MFRTLARIGPIAAIRGGANFGSGQDGMLGPTGGGLHVDFGFNLLTSFGLGEPVKQMAQGAIITLAAMADAARGARLGV